MLWAGGMVRAVYLLVYTTAFLLVLICAPSAAWGQERKTAIRVEHAAGSAVYLDSGARDGLGVGDRVEVRRDGGLVALLEVVHVTPYTAACRVLHRFSSLIPGDAAFKSESEELTVIERPPRVSPVEIEDEPLSPIGLPMREQAPPPPRAVLSGTAYFRYQDRQLNEDLGDTDPLSWAENTLRLSLRAREIGGKPLSLTVRARGRDRTRSGGLSRPVSQSSNRYYDLSLLYDRRDRNSWVRVGRLGSTPEVGAGYLDGAAAQIGLSRRFGLGAFYGGDALAEDDLFGSDRTKYGTFLSFATSGEGPRYAEVIASAIGEYRASEVNREYLYLQTRIGNRGRWSLYQQAEVDMNRDWRAEAAGDSYQISNLSISGSYRFSRAFRTNVSYNARRRYYDLDVRELPEQQFNDFLREGARVSFYFRSKGGINSSVGLGGRGGEGDTDSIQTLFLSANHGNVFGKRLFLGFDYSSYSGRESDGFLLTLRGRKYLKGGHDLGLTFGWSESSSIATPLPRELQWVRLDTTIQLPRNLFLLVEVELGEGDDSELRQMLQLGYRF